MRGRKKRSNTIVEQDIPVTLDEIFEILSSSDEILLNTHLAEMSDLTPDELNRFKHLWTTLDNSRRNQVISRLVELAEDNTEYNFDDIFNYCLKDGDPEVRYKAIEGLWENEEPSLINKLIALANEDNSEDVQAMAASALGKFAVLAELGKLRPNHTNNVANTLTNILNNKSKPIEVRRRALEAVSVLNLPQVKKTISEAYHSKDNTLKISAIYSMGKNCDPNWLPLILKEFSNTNDEIRYEAARACGEIGEEEAVPDLIYLLDDPDIDVQVNAIKALGEIGGSEAKDYLVKCLASPNDVIKEAAELALEQIAAEEDTLSFDMSDFEFDEDESE